MNRNRNGSTHLELIVAAVLLTATLAGITAYRQRTIVSNQMAQRSSLAQSRVLNMRREIGTWSIDEITVANIEKLPADELGGLPEARWVAAVSEIETPVTGKQVTLALQWKVGATSASSPSLTFWVKRP